MAGENCRSGCKTRDHASWGDCARASNVGITAGESAPAFYGGREYNKKEWNSELNHFDAAWSSGISPESTKRADVDAAINATKLLGRPYKAESDPPAKLIQTKAAATFVKETSIG